MLTRLEKAQKKWGGTHDAVDQWLAERKELLVKYCQLAGLPPFQETATVLPEKDSIQGFCAALMDYVSAGHFEVYDKILEECEQQDKVGELSGRLYPKISATTDDALTFHDTYAELNEEQDLDSFDTHLSKLGQRLEERFELEDKLIQSLHASA